VERFPFAVATLKAIEAHCFKGTSLTNSMIRNTIDEYKIPNVATMSASQNHDKWLDDFKSQWKAVQHQPGVVGTSRERFDKFLARLDKCSQTFHCASTTSPSSSTTRKLPESTKTLPLLIKNLKKWVAEQILHRQATQKGGTTAVSANAINTGG
jgi:hypothetical protein